MEKIGRLVRQVSENEIRRNIKDRDGFLVVGYSGLSGPDANTLRQSLRDNKSRLFVIKNSISKRVFKEKGIDGLSAMLQGPCGLVFIGDDLIIIAKLLNNFAKEHESFQIAGGILKDRILNKSDIVSLAKLSSKRTLHTQLVMSMKFPITGLVCSLNNILNKLVFVLAEVKKKK